MSTSVIEQTPQRVSIGLVPYGTKQGQSSPPNPTQQKVLDWIDTQVNKYFDTGLDHIPVLYLQGGVGSGKSRALLAPAIELLCSVPELRVLWGRHDFKDIKLSIMDKFFEILPSHLIGKKSEQYSWYDIKHPPKCETKSRIYFTGLKDLSGLGSQEFGVILVTEAHEITYQIYMALKRRCRQENVVNLILMEGEAPNNTHWLAHITDPAHDDYDPDIEQWIVSTYENWNNLPQSYRGSLERMPEAWKKKYLLGGYGFIPDGKPYYSGFRELLHTGTFEWIPERPLIFGWDFGYHHPACIITQIDLQDRWIWLREIIGTDITINKFADRVIAEVNEYYPNAECIHYGDPAVIQVNDKSEQTSYQILQAKKIQLQYRQSEYRQRKEIIENKLSTLHAGKPTIMVDARCRTAVEGFLGGYHYPVHKEGQSFNIKFELPFMDGYYEHIMNAGEYIAVNMFSPINLKRKPRPKNEGPENMSNI